MIFVLEYQTRRITFSNIIFSFIHSHQILFSKNVPYFCRLSTRLSYKMSKNPLRNFIEMQNPIEIHLSHYESPNRHHTNQRKPALKLHEINVLQSTNKSATQSMKKNVSLPITPNMKNSAKISKRRSAKQSKILILTTKFLYHLYDRDHSYIMQSRGVAWENQMITQYCKICSFC